MGARLELAFEISISGGDLRCCGGNKEEPIRPPGSSVYKQGSQSTAPVVSL